MMIKEKFNNMKKFGFTLAEVLITLGIIGVVAALTTPALYHNAGLAQVGPKLAKVKSTIENANKMMLQENEVGMLSTLFMDLYQQERNGQSQGGLASRDSYIAQLQRFMRLEPGQRVQNIAAYDGTSLGNDWGGLRFNYNSRRPNQANQGIIVSDIASAPSFRTAEEIKLGFDIYFNLNGLMSGGSNPLSDDYMGMIFVDINGSAGPNRCGKDIFAFILINDGSLLPFGTSATTVVNGNTVFRQREPMRAADACPDANGNVLSTKAGGYGLSCTAKIFEDNLRVTYED